MPVEKFATEPIGYEEAAGYIQNLKIYRSQERNVQNSIGGTFNLRKFKDWEGQGLVFSGIMCWFCKDKSNFFIAIEPRFNFEYDEHSLHKVKPESEYLFVPPQILDNSILAGDNLQEGEMERRLRGFRKPMVKPNKREKNKDVVKWVNNFMIDPKSKELSSYGFTYFTNKGKTKDGVERFFISEFLEQNQIMFVRYFFGLNPSWKGDQLRVILVPVDLSGKNIETSQGSLMEDNLLQKSWPPPPNT